MKRPVPAPADPNPCLSCGACCTQYRVSFHWTETTLGDDLGIAEPGNPRVPAELTTPIDLHRQAMLGTVSSPIRCIALEGEIGCSARCSIHPVRSTPCREFARAWENGEPNERCDAARIAAGLQPLPEERIGLPSVPADPPVPAAPHVPPVLPLPDPSPLLTPDSTTLPNLDPAERVGFVPPPTA